MDKPVGPTSHDVVAAARRMLGIRRVGHAGTLDPGASGLLVLLLGRATRLARFIALVPKRYSATLRFGWETSTDDAEGEPVERDESWRALGAPDIARAAAEIAARPTQVPPAISAKKVAGERAYRRARRGETVELKPVPVTVFDLRLSTFDSSTGAVGLDVVCSSGTYVRAIARDLGRALRTRAHLAALRRLAIGLWSVDGALPLEALSSEAVAQRLRPMAEAVAHLPRFDVAPEAGRRFRHGQKIDAAQSREGYVAVFEGDALLGVAESRDGLYRPVVGLAS